MRTTSYRRLGRALRASLEASRLCAELGLVTVTTLCACVAESRTGLRFVLSYHLFPPYGAFIAAQLTYHAPTRIIFDCVVTVGCHPHMSVH